MCLLEGDEEENGIINEKLFFYFYFKVLMN